MFLFINDTVQIKMCLMAHQNIVWHVWTTSHQLQKLMTKLQVKLFVMDTELLHNFSFVRVRVQVTLQDCPVRHV
jgi:hypothetical protein